MIWEPPPAIAVAPREPGFVSFFPWLGLPDIVALASRVAPCQNLCRGTDSLLPPAFWFSSRVGATSRPPPRPPPPRTHWPPSPQRVPLPRAPTATRPWPPATAS